MGKVVNANEEAKRMKKAYMHYGHSSEDYISGRCLVINQLLIPGLVLQVIAIEKMLKAIIGAKDLSCNLRAFKHDIKKLFNQVNQYKDYDIARFEYYVPKLEQIYKMRYHDNDLKEFSYEGPEDEGVLDDIYIELVDQIKLAPEIKYQGGLMATVFDRYDQIRQHKKWALLWNRALMQKYKSWEAMSNKYFSQ